MTIKELYYWANAHDAEDLDITYLNEYSEALYLQFNDLEIDKESSRIIIYTRACMG